MCTTFISSSFEVKVQSSTFNTHLENLTITTGEKLILTCELNAEGKNVKWYKINGALTFRAICTDDKIADSNAHQYQLEINHVKMEDAGDYRCGIENVITICNVMVRERTEIQIDASVKTTELLYELNSTNARLVETNDEILHTKTKLDLAEREVKEKEIIIRERKKEIAELKTLIKEQEDTLKIKESEIENKEKYIKELEGKNQKLAESVKILESICKYLKFTKQQSAQMKEHIEKLEGEKQHLEEGI